MRHFDTDEPTKIRANKITNYRETIRKETSCERSIIQQMKLSV